MLYSSKGEDRFVLYAFIIALLGLLINGFWIVGGLTALSY